MFAFLLVVGVSYYAVATSLIGLVGDYLFADRRSSDQAITEQLAVEIAPLYVNARINDLQTLLVASGGELGGRLMVLDMSGMVQADSFSELVGSLVELPEVASILTDGQTVDYGVHQLGSRQKMTFFSYVTPLNANAQWVGYSTAALTSGGQTVGLLLFSSPIQDVMQNLAKLQGKMWLYFLVTAAVASAIALLLSRIVTKPVATITRSIQRMGRGDLSVRVPVKGSGEMRKLSEAFNVMSEKLEMLDKSRNQFVSNASHELKTPLATMKILLENIIYQPDMDAAVRMDFLSDVNREINRLNMIISDLLTLVSMDSKNMRLKRETIKFAQVVKDVSHRLGMVAERRRQQIKLQISDNCEMYADTAKLTQVVYNIMDNAIKYTPEGGLIRVRLIRMGRDAILTIADNGPGIPQQDLPHIFDRFYRVDKARSRDTGGTGLGLSIVNQLVLMHGGTVSVQSEEGHGTTFTVELPIHQG
ncbi:MAG: cell wall metabolism sensor histidine kinase WalK [Eubacteriales bacterium]|nr:cell wall metabolism sensor histidine kinase WalK [Eubacteriales bacterium]